MIPRTISALMFDMDGTLAITDHLHKRAFNEFLEARGIYLQHGDFERKIAGRSNRAIMESFFPQRSESAYEDLAYEKEALFRELAQGAIVPTPGAIQLISECYHSGFIMCLVTNAPRENAVFVLNELGLSHAFEHVVIADELPHGKPHPLPYQEALKRSNRHCEEALAFEDSMVGVASAREAGIKVVGVSTALDDQTLRSHGAFQVIPDFTRFVINSALEAEETLPAEEVF